MRAVIEIRHRHTGAVLLAVDADTLAGADLAGAKLQGANLEGAILRYAILTHPLARRLCNCEFEHVRDSWMTRFGGES